MRKQRSTGELEKKVSGSIRSTASCTSWISTGSSQSAMGESYNTDSNASFIVEDEHMDVNTTETYVGEWKNDKRCGFGIAERTDGLKYEGEWFANKKYGYGVTTFKDGTKEEGKYKNNVLVTSQKKKHLFLIRSAKLKERIEAAVNAAHRASKIALQKADIAISRMATARGKAELSDIAADHAREDYEIAKLTAKQFAPDFIQPGLEKTRLREILKQRMSIDQKAMMSMQQSAGPSSSQQPEAAVDMSSLSLNNDLSFAGGGGGGGGHQSFDSKDAPETTPQFRPRSHYAQPYYQSTGNGQQPSTSGVNLQNSMGQTYGRNSLTPDTRQNNSLADHNASQHGYMAAPPPPPSRMNNGNDQYSGANNPQGSFYGGGGGGGHRRSFAQNGGGPTTRQSLIDRSSRPPPPMASQAVYQRNDESAGLQNHDSNSRLNRHSQFDGNTDDETDPSMMRRSNKYVNKESLYSFQQAMSDHFDHYKRPPSRDNSVDRYSRAASRLSGGSRQSSVEKSQQQQQQQQQQQPRRGADDGAAEKPYAATANLGVAQSKQNFPAMAAAAQLPFEEIILRQRNLGQEIVPSPVGQPKRTESLYVNPNTARKESKPKVSACAPTAARYTRFRSKSCSGGECGVAGRKPRLLPPLPALPPTPLRPLRR